MTEPVIKRTCRHCNQPYLRFYNHQIYCSPECAFLSRVQIGEEHNCWNWGGSTHQFGYGEFRFHHTLYRAHRFSFAYFNKKPYQSVLNVNHKCDNPTCVNPHHLYEGTQKNNMEDMAVRLRHGKSKLGPDEVCSIRILAEKGTTQTKIASMFSVCQATISSIKRNEHWCHVK